MDAAAGAAGLIAMLSSVSSGTVRRMAVTLVLIACILPIFAAVSEGSNRVQVEYTKNMTAMTGQDVQLSCVVTNSSGEVKVSQVEWKKVGVKGESESLLVVHSAHFPTHKYWSNVSLVEKKKDGELRGSTLQLHRVAVWDSGSYLCELTTFPSGSIRRVINLRVTDPVHPTDVKLSVSVMEPKGLVIEGDNVTILCNSTPPSEIFSLWSSKHQMSVKTNRGGVFSLWNVTRNSSGFYLCQPGWQQSAHPMKNISAEVNLTVHYLDDLRCNASTTVDVDPGENMTISCVSDTSRPVRYTWIKDNDTVSTSAQLQLHSVGAPQAGVYTITVTMDGIPALQKQASVNVTVRRKSAPGWQVDSPYTTSVTQNISGSSSAPWSTGPSTSTPEPSPQSGTAAFSATTVETQQDNGTTLRKRVNILSSDGPFASSSTILPWLEKNATTLGVSMGGQVTASPWNTASLWNTALPTNTGTRNRLGWLLPFLALAAVGIILYIRHMILKRMDKPPSFKPPPPPVKYAPVHVKVAPIADINMSSMRGI